MQDTIRRLLAELGEDPAREGLLDTPKRVEQSLRFLTSGYSTDVDTVINNALFTVEYNEMVMVRDIITACASIMLPFSQGAGRLCAERQSDWSKVRLVDIFSRRLQVQERLTSQIAECLNDRIQPLGVAVVMEATHLCKAMRGVQKQNSITITSAMRGSFQADARTRQEFLTSSASKPPPAATARATAARHR
jgi:GTP cyclohydrolase I